MAEKTIILTMYGKKDAVECFSITLFDNIETYYSKSKNNAINYCNNINDLELNDEKWVHASIIGENTKIIIAKPHTFDILNKMDERCLQRVLREISNKDLAKALLDTNEAIKEKLFENMSRRSVAMLKEDMETLKDISINEIKESRNNILAIIRRLSDTGEIIV